MKALVEQEDGSYQEEERGDPVCGEDFCDACGDCLSCFGSDPCYDDQRDQHFWVIYKQRWHVYPEQAPSPVQQEADSHGS